MSAQRLGGFSHADVPSHRTLYCSFKILAHITYKDAVDAKVHVQRMYPPGLQLSQLSEMRMSSMYHRTRRLER